MDRSWDRAFASERSSAWCLHLAASPLPGLSSLVRDFVAGQVDVLRDLAKQAGNVPLPSYALVAERQAEQG